MKLLTKAILAAVPPLYAMDAKPADQVPIVAKFFTPWSNWTWFMTEYDPIEQRAFGYVKGQDAELGYFSMAELAEIRGPGGLRIERDRHYGKHTLAEVMAGERSAQ